MTLLTFSRHRNLVFFELEIIANFINHMLNFLGVEGYPLLPCLTLRISGLDWGGLDH